jgi:hypothetical protein
VCQHHVLRSLCVSPLTIYGFWQVLTLPGLLNNIFPVQLVWLSSLFLFLGGGTVVFDAMTFSIVADATIPSNK